MSEQAQACQDIELKNKLACQNEQICQLKEKLESYDELVNKNNVLQREFDKLKQWLENVVKHEDKTNKEMLNNLELQKQKLCESKLSECKLQTENKKLQEDIDCMKEHIDNYKKNEQKHCMDLEDLEIQKNRVLNDLCNAKVEIEEISGLLEFLRNQLKCKESKYCTIECQLDECKTMCSRLRDECTDLKTELECKKSELAAAKSQATMTEEKLKLDRESSSNEADAERKKVHVLEIDYCEAKRTIANDKVKMRKLDSLVIELREASEKDRCEMNNRVQKYKKELCAKDEVISNLKTQLGELQHENECMASEIKSLKKQLDDAECKLESLKHQTSKRIEQLEREKKSMLCDLHEKNKKIAGLESEACVLRDRIKKLESEACALREKITGLESETCALRNRITGLESEVCALKNKNKDLDDRNCNLNDKMCNLKDQSCRENKVGSNGACSSCPKSTCQTPATQCPQPSTACPSAKDCGGKGNNFIDELKQLYSGLQEVRQSTKNCMTKNQN